MALTKASLIDVNGQELILDADADTSIAADTDDEIHFKVGGSETAYMGVTSYNASDRLVLTNTAGNASMTIVGGTSGESSIFMADGTSGDASYRGYLQYQHTNDNWNFGVAGAEKMKLTSDGKLYVTEIAHITSGNLEIGNGDEKQIFNASGAFIQFQTSDSERMRITDSNVFINQTATADSGVADGRLEITRGSQHCLNCHVAGTGNSTLVAFINDNGFVGGINTNGSATSFNTSSDARLKNVLGEAKGLEVVNALNPVNFEWKSDGKIQDGLIAQEVEKVFPDAVSEPELEGEWYSVDYSKLVTPLIKGMQEQQEQIEELKKEIETLKN